MAVRSKYFSEQELQRFIDETEAAAEQQQLQAAIQREADQRLQQVMAFINDPQNRAAIDAHPDVQRLRAIAGPATPAAQPAKPSQPQVYVPRIIDPLVK